MCFRNIVIIEVKIKIETNWNAAWNGNIERFPALFYGTDVCNFKYSLRLINRNKVFNFSHDILISVRTLYHKIVCLLFILL